MLNIKTKNMKKADLFPGQGSQFSGMGRDLYENNAVAKMMFDRANEILGFKITDNMFSGTDEELKQTKVTQPAIFLHSVILHETLGDSVQAAMVAGHSLGEFSALVVDKRLSGEGVVKFLDVVAGQLRRPGDSVAAAQI